MAGIFLLRTLIEQWARIRTKGEERDADKVLQAYMATLPHDFRERFPSMPNVYGELSADLHTATGSAELFDKAVGEIDQHFDAPRLHRVPDEDPQPASEPDRAAVEGS